MSLIEVIAVVFSLLSVLYTVNKSIWSWIWGFVGIIFYGVLFYQNNMLSNLLLQFVFIGQTFYGLYNWNKNSEENVLIIESAKVHEILLSIISVVILSFLFKFLFKNSTYIIMDSITTALSIVAYYLLSRRKIENWFFWIIADVIYIYMFFIQKLYLSSLLYLVFLILCIIGYKKWKNGRK